jgi:Domain of unknown function (DUF6431)
LSLLVGRHEETMAFKLMPILISFSLCINRYFQEILSFNADTFCPCCGRRLRKHGSYKRTVVLKHGVYVIPILRRRCPSCDVTFSLLPSFITPFMRFANHIREFLGRWLLAGVPLVRLPERLSTESVSIVSLRTLYRWKRRLQSRFVAWWLEQRTAAAISPDLLESLLDSYRDGMNSEQERYLLFTHFFRGKRVPRMGKLLSMINLQVPPQVRW